MRAVISINRRDVYTPGGSYDTSLYEVQANLDDEYIQDIQLEHAEDLITLRDALTEYIERNNITPTDTNTEQQ